MTEVQAQGEGRPPTAPARQPGGSRRSPWILGIVVAFVLGLAIPTGGASTPVGLPPLVGGIKTTGYSAPFTLEASSALGRELNVQYDNGHGGTDSAPRGTSSSFSITIPTATQYSSGFLVVSSSPSYEEFVGGGDPKSDTVACRITDASGAVVSEQQASGQSANANCLGY